ncbi:hypothetical protein AAFF_G00210760 [Aldrovandia affinis]|uniref:Uncharacterized protein n=1 Tax=Aldrovandia affinis TaxID=143900 RepID=A0AAD7SWN2_9TELE|nr:hypothetical protein AAFF_G00210760 [Aldrovandia affinis]
MASRRKQINPLKRAGLRILSGQRLLEEPASASEEEEAGAIGGGLLLKKEEENMSSEGEWYDSGDMGAHPKVNPQHATVAPPPESEIVTLLRDFLTTQQRREDGLREEIQGLRTSFLGAQAGVRETVLESPRMALPTPAPRCRGKALEAYTAMDEERSDVYRDLKEALLRKFDITPETYRLWF